MNTRVVLVPAAARAGGSGRPTGRSRPADPSSLLAAARQQFYCAAGVTYLPGSIG